MEKNVTSDNNAELTDHEQLKMCILDFSEQSTIHGVRYIFNPGHKWKKQVVWSLLIAGFTVVLLYSLTDSLLKYYSYKTVTSTDIYNAEQIALSSITVCPNILVTDEGVSTNFHPNESSIYFNEIKPYFLGYNVTLSDKAWKILNSTSLKEIFNKTLPPNLISGCTVKTQVFDCKEFSESFFSIEHGLCFTFHSQNYIRKHGEVTLDHQGHTRSFNVRINYNFSYLNWVHRSELGIQVKIHSPKIHLPDMSDNSFGVSFGHVRTYVAMEKQESKILGKPYSGEDCVEHETNILSNLDSYSMENCRGKCRLDMILEECKCTIDESAHRFCIWLNWPCIKQLRNATYLEKAKKKCQCCMPSCHEIQYSRTISVKENFKPKFGRLETNEFIFYFNSMRVTSLRQVPSVDLIDLLSGIGGLMGLFVGASLISCFECVDFFVLYIWNKLLLKKKHKVEAMSGKE